MHTNVNTPSFTVYVNTDSYFCFGEGVGGDAVNFLSRMEHISYAEAKKRMDGDTSFQEEFEQMMDAGSVKEEVDYLHQLNSSASKICRDIMYAHPDQVDNILKFLQRLDKDVLTKPVTRDILKQGIEESWNLRGGL